MRNRLVMGAIALMAIVVFSPRVRAQAKACAERLNPPPRRNQQRLKRRMWPQRSRRALPACRISVETGCVTAKAEDSAAA